MVTCIRAHIARNALCISIRVMKKETEDYQHIHPSSSSPSSSFSPTSSPSSYILKDCRMTSAFLEYHSDELNIHLLYSMPKEAKYVDIGIS